MLCRRERIIFFVPCGNYVYNLFFIIYSSFFKNTAYAIFLNYSFNGYSPILSSDFLHDFPTGCRARRKG